MNPFNYKRRFFLKNFLKIWNIKKKKNRIKKILTKNSNLKKTKNIKLNTKKIEKNYKLCLLTGRRRGISNKSNLFRLNKLKNFSMGNLINYTSADW